MNWNLYIKRNWISLTANTLILWVLLMIFMLFYLLQKVSYRRELSSTQFQIFTTLGQPLYEAGMILTFGLLIMLIAKSTKKNIIVIVMGILTILFYFWKMKIVGIA